MFFCLAGIFMRYRNVRLKYMIKPKAYHEKKNEKLVV